MTESTAWYWSYFKPADTWQLHTPCYEPEVSWKVTRKDGKQFIGHCTETTMPASVQRIIQKIAETTGFWDVLDEGVVQINLQKDEIIKYSRRLDTLVEVWKQIDIKKKAEAQPAEGATS